MRRFWLAWAKVLAVTCQAFCIGYAAALGQRGWHVPAMYVVGVALAVWLARDIRGLAEEAEQARRTR